MAHFEIESGVPMPKKKPGRGVRGPLAMAMSSIQVGESFLMPSRKRAQVNMSKKRHGIEVETRIVDADTIRVWRIA